MKSIFKSQNFASWAFGSATFDGGMLGSAIAMMMTAMAPKRKRTRKRSKRRAVKTSTRRRR